MKHEGRNLVQGVKKPCLVFRENLKAWGSGRPWLHGGIKGRDSEKPYKPCPLSKFFAWGTPLPSFPLWWFRYGEGEWIEPVVDLNRA